MAAELLGHKDVQTLQGPLHLVVCVLMCTSVLAITDSPGADIDLPLLHHSHGSEAPESSFPRRQLQPRAPARNDVIETNIVHPAPDNPINSFLEPVSCNSRTLRPGQLKVDP